MMLAVPFFEETRKFSLALPNASNFSFNFALCLKVYMFACLPGKVTWVMVTKRNTCILKVQ